MDDRWRALWTRIRATGDPDLEFAGLRRRYAEPHRAYHTLDHIAHCLDELEPARSQAPHPDAVELALWYHDAVYKPRKSDNEERSADLLREMAGKASLSAELGEKAGDLILASKHREVPADPDARLFVDVDLAILGQSWDRFSEYEKQVRREYKWVLSWIFKKKRAGLLKSFLARPALYCTRFFQDKYEAQARQNIQMSLRSLD